MDRPGREVSIEDEGVSIVVRASMFHETRPVRFDARVWMTELINREGDVGEYNSGFHVIGRGDPNPMNNTFPSGNMMRMGPGSFNLEFKMRYHSPTGTLRVVRAKVTPGKYQKEFVLDLNRLDENWQTRQVNEIVTYFDTSAFSQSIHTQLAHAMQMFLDRIFVL